VLVLELVEAVERVVVQLPTCPLVPVQLLTVGVRRLGAVLVDVVHPLLPVLCEFVQLFSDERREVEVLVLNLLVLVFPNGDCLPFHRNTRYGHYTDGSDGRHGPVDQQQEQCIQTMTAVYPRPTALLGLRPALLLNDGRLLPEIS